MPWLCIVFNLRIFNLKKERSLFCLWIKLFCHTIARPTNFHGLFERDFAFMRLRLSRRLLGFAGSSLGQIGLVALPLSMGQVISLIVVQRQAKLTLIASKVVSHKVRILGEVDRLKG